MMIHLIKDQNSPGESGRDSAGDCEPLQIFV